jgi:hypothetical protein
MIQTVEITFLIIFTTTGAALLRQMHTSSVLYPEVSFFDYQ